MNYINSLPVQVVDNLSMKMVSACTKMHELSAEGITSKRISMRMRMKMRIRMRMKMRMRMSMSRIATYIELKTARAKMHGVIQNATFHSKLDPGFLSQVQPQQ